MNLPPFQDFLNSMEWNKVRYDIGLYSVRGMDEKAIPFSKEQYDLLCDTSIVLIKVFLAQYHQWLNEKLSKQDIE